MEVMDGLAFSKILSGSSREKELKGVKVNIKEASWVAVAVIQDSPALRSYS